MPRQLPRVAFTATSFISLAICIATLGLWFSSTQRLDRFRSGSATRRVTVHCKDGEIYVDLSTASSPMFRPGFQHIHALPTQFRPPNHSWEFAGLGGGSQTLTGQGAVRSRFVKIPLWPVVVLSAVLPVLWFDARGRKTGGGAPDAPGAANSLARPRA